VNICDAAYRSELVASAGRSVFVLKNWYGAYDGDKLVRVRP
jgi:hypothetical protein